MKPDFNFLKWLAYIVVRALARIGDLLSPEAANSAARGIGKALYYLLPGRRRVAMENLTIAFGEGLSKEGKNRIIKASFEHILVSLMEVFRISHVLKQGIEKSFTIRGLDHFEKALARKKGIIFIVSHIGSWEYLSFLFYLTGYPGSVLVKNVRNFYIFDWLNRLRRKTTLGIIHKEEAKPALREILRELSRNHIVAILMDQWAGNEEPWVDFFGRPASTTSIPARIALKTGCALVPGACLRKAPGQYEITLFPEVPVDSGTDDYLTVTRRLNQVIEAQIREHPEQWLWTHKRWKGKKKYPGTQPDGRTGQGPAGKAYAGF
ncbi:MAG: hypothetical protein A2Z83_00835 [Omnitrophica bacterium GWA2_52_8]|nr:MAG: hypothetical protein A2Z83_00835 [Omnitrophica bacterium GWA2_52_8]